MALLSAALVAPLALLLLVAKVHKLVVLDALRLADLPALLAMDIVFLLLLGAAVRALLGLFGAKRPRTLWVLQGLLAALFLVALVEHIFFAHQGEFLSGKMLVYGIEEASMISGAVSSKLGVGTALALAGFVPAVLFVPVLLRRTSLGARPAPAFPGSRGWLLWGAALFACLGLSLREADTTVPRLERSALITLAGEALRHDDDATVPALDRPLGSPLTLARTPGTRLANVVFVILESARATSTTPYTPELETTPFLAELARRGVRVEQAYAVVPHTSKALLPILCGITPKISTAIHEARPGGIPERCLPELLSDEGYATAFIQPAEEDFEKRRQLIANFGYQSFLGKESLPRASFEESSYFGYEDDSVLEPALDWASRQRRPFFLTVLTLTAHHDYTLPSRFPEKDYVPARVLNRYLNALAYTDSFLEKLFDGFAARGLARNTLFVIVGDHGEAFGEHGRWEHDNVLYEEGVRVPLVLVGEGVEDPGGVIGGLRLTSDIVPTVLEILGFEPRGGSLVGRSLLSSPGHRRLFFACWYARHCLGLREGALKTLYHYDQRGPEIFDLSSDPMETHNLARHSAHHRGRLLGDVERMQAWKRQNNARYTLGTRAPGDRPTALEPSDADAPGPRPPDTGRLNASRPEPR